jgi:hypothetical protein
VKAEKVQTAGNGIPVRLAWALMSLLGGFFYTHAAQAVDIEFDGSRILESGSDCEAGATYRFGTSTRYAGKSLDVLVELIDDNNDFSSVTTGSGNTYRCIDVISDDPAQPVLFTLIGNDGNDNGDSTEPWSTDLRLTIVEKGTNTPVALDSLPVTVFDLDIKKGNGGENVTGTDNIMLGNDIEPILSTDSLLRQSNIDMTLPNGTHYGRLVSGTDEKDCNPSTEIPCRTGFIVTNRSGFSIRVLNNKSDANSPRLFQFGFTARLIDELADHPNGRSADNAVPGEIRTGLDGSGIGALGWWALLALPLSWRRRFIHTAH